LSRQSAKTQNGEKMVVVDARWAGLSISETDDLMGCAQPSLEFIENG